MLLIVSSWWLLRISLGGLLRIVSGGLLRDGVGGSVGTWVDARSSIGTGLEEDVVFQDERLVEIGETNVITLSATVSNAQSQLTNEPAHII